MNNFLHTQEGVVAQLISWGMRIQLVLLFFFFAPGLPLDFAKVYALFFSSMILLVLMMVHVALTKKIVIPTSFIDVMVYVGIVASGIIGLIGPSFEISMWGIHMEATYALVTVIGIFVLYLAHRIFTTEISEYRTYLTIVGVLAYGLAALFFLSIWFGAPVMVASSSATSHLILLLIGSVCLYARGVTHATKLWRRVLIGLSCIGYVYALVYEPVITGLFMIPVCATYLLAHLSRYAIRSVRMITAGALLVITSLALVIPATLPFARVNEVTMPLRPQLEVVQTILTQQPFFGTGPLFGFNALYAIKPLALNETVLWNVDMQSFSSTALELLATLGIFGILPLIIAGISFARTLYRRLVVWDMASYESLQMRESVVVLAGSIVGLVMISLVHLFSLIELVVGGVLILLIVQVTQQRARTYRLSSNMLALVMYGVGMIWCVTFYYSIPAVTAYTVYTQQDVTLDEIDYVRQMRPYDAMHTVRGVDVMLEEALNEERDAQEAITTIEAWYAEALENIQQVSDARLLYMSMRQVYSRTGILPQAWDTLLERLMREDPYNPQYHATQAILLLSAVTQEGENMGEEKTAYLTQALEAIQKALQLQTSNWELYLVQGDILTAQAEYEAARGSYLIAYGLHPYAYDVVKELVATLVRLEQKVEAQVIIEAYLPYAQEGEYEELTSLMQ